MPAAPAVETAPFGFWYRDLACRLQRRTATIGPDEASKERQSMIRFARPTHGRPVRPVARPTGLACLLCRGTRIRLVHKPQADDSRSAPVVAVCESCKHFWPAPATA